MKKILLMMVIIMSCTKIEQNINSQKFNEIMDGDEIVLLDVRTPEEFNAEKIKGSILLNMYDSQASAKVASFDRDKTYLVYCRTGHRSGHMTNLMVKMGLKAHNLLGGISEWKRKDYPVVR